MTASDRTAPVGVFDSGVGGLTVLHELLVSLPHEDFVFLGDTARFPYGGRAEHELRSFALELGEQLISEHGAKLLVVACNSATAVALPALCERFSSRIGVVGVVSPEARVAAEQTRNGRIGLLATPITVKSGAYARELAAIAPEARLFPVACPGLADLIQQLEEVDAQVVDAVEAACSALRSADVDTVILGCTHYPLVRPLLQRSLGRGVRVVGSGAPVAHEVERRLAADGLENDEDRRGHYRFLCSGDREAFRRVGTRFLKMPLDQIAKIEVAEPRAAEGALR